MHVLQKLLLNRCHMQPRMRNSLKAMPPQAPESKVLCPLNLHRTTLVHGGTTSLSHWAFHAYPVLSLPPFGQDAPWRGKVPLNTFQYLPAHNTLRGECQLLNETRWIHHPPFSLSAPEPPLSPYSPQSERPNHAPACQARQRAVILLPGQPCAPRNTARRLRDSESVGAIVQLRRSQ